MSGQFPPIEPYDSGMLDVGGQHRVYWECCGNPTGRPALFLHGGPGSGCSANQRRFFDPSLYNTVLFDQRGSGRSRPLASDPNADLSTNTTQHLIADIEALRELRRVDRWTILGLSWGCTLGLAYAQTYPNRVNALVLAFVTRLRIAKCNGSPRTSGACFRSNGNDLSMPYRNSFGISGRSKPMLGCLRTVIQLPVISLPENGVPGKTPMSP